MILTAVIDPNSNATVYTESVYQYDKNITLVIEGIELPNRYEVHFSNDREQGVSVSCIGKADGVAIPNAFLITGKYIYAWICVPSGSTGAAARYMVTIPVILRPAPVPVQIVSDGSVHYDVIPSDENMIFYGNMNNALEPNVEREDD